MSDVEPELQAVAEAVREGRDNYEIPTDLVVDPVEPEERPKNLQARIQMMSVGERLKLALKGNRDARSILIRDANRLVQRFVLQNPRITEDELIQVAKNRNAERELLETIAKKREWTANYQVRLALVTNPKTPMGLAVRFVATLGVRDLRLLAKSKNVPSAVNSLAKRMVIERGGGSS